MGSVDTKIPLSEKYGPEVQYVTLDTPLEDVFYLIKRDGGVFVRNFVSEEDVDRAYADVKDRLEAAPIWNGEFFPSKTNDIPHLLRLTMSD